MSLIASVIRAAERAPLPDSLAQMGIEFLVGRTRRKLAAEGDVAESDFVRAMSAHPIAAHADAANKQHYELPPEFFALTLGPVENQDSTCGLVVIQALDGTIRTDRRPMGEDGAALSG